MSGTRILVVEDEGIIARDIQSQLWDLGYEPVDIAVTGEEAVELAQELRPQLVLMDINLLGEMDGIQAATEIRRRLAIPAVFLTAYATREIVERAKTAQPLGYIIKPFDSQSLRTTIEIALHTDKMERELRLHSAAMDAAVDAIVITGLDGVIQWVNAAFMKLTGYRGADALGRNHRELLRSSPRAPVTVEEVLQTLCDQYAWIGEMTEYRQDGTAYSEEESITCLTDPDGVPTHYICVKRDLTEKILLQQQLLQAQKMEVLGRLAGGVAHDFNNLLTVINGTCDLALRALTVEDQCRADFLEIRGAGDRAAKLTQQLLAFSRKQIVAPVLVSLGQRIREGVGTLRRLVGEDIELLVTSESIGTDTVLIDPGQFDQVLLNLVVNARDAMPEGGTLRVETRVADVLPRRSVVMEVTDSGSGIPAEIREQIFEPFFTTKAVGKGTGLGLATVFGIITQAGGRIEVDSEPGHGATFRVFLPCVGEAVETRKAATTAPVGTESILLVEDEAVVRRLTARLLRGAGYEVHEVGSPAQALALLPEGEVHVDLVLSDLVMPGMSGKDLEARVAPQHPELRFVFMSGYIDEDRVGPVEENIHFLGKPFTDEALRSVIRAALDAATPPVRA